MKPLEWLPSFEIGVPAIDDDHKDMVALVNAAHSAFRDNRYDLVRQRIIDLLESAAGHFEREEAFLRAHGFPDTDQHAAYHDGLLRQAERMKQVCERLSTPAEIDRCYSDMVRLLIDDIVTGDMSFKSWLEEKSLSRARR